MKNPCSELLDDGLYIFKDILDQLSIEKLYKKIKDKRKFSPEIFQTEEGYKLEESHLKHNPTPDFNFLNQFNEDLKFIEQDINVRNLVTKLLGEDYEIVIRKAVCGVPSSWLPDWVNSKIKGNLKPIRTRQDLDSLGKPILKEKVNL